MAELKMTKNELRAQQNRLGQLFKYLPTLQLKKALLQAEVAEGKLQASSLEEEVDIEKHQVDEYASLFTQNLPVDVSSFAKITKVEKRYENIAGAEVPIFENATFGPITYNLFETPIWLEGAIMGLRRVSVAKVKLSIVQEKLMVLEKELREVSIRVNLFEKILIPRCERNIKKIKVFLGDQQLAAVSQAKVAKQKIIERKEAEHAL
ncbi:MAG: V-type ATP synthase subunit D [Verrucomicrobia bacterium]|nr:V-type ATP synthase subunit D [Verrucomicrobiota bacterium]